MTYVQPDYSSEIRKVLASLLLFLVTYLVLTLLAFALAAALVFLGIALLLAKPMFITIMICIGMVVLGGMLAFFMVKFIFTMKKTDLSQYLEIHPDDQPELYEWIRTLTRETGNPMPKKVYLSADVNAAVFYDSSFFSMFFPVRKNLVIGLGMVTALNQGEFRAVLAHEFGHFSQKSMRWGSYVYHANLIIHNILYENEGYGNFIENWAKTSGYFALFGILNVKIVQAFQWILRKVYLVVNKTNLSLSRRMEHHADAISAGICGLNAEITALHRMEIAGRCYQQLMDFYNQGIKDNLKPDNQYPQLRSVIQSFCEQQEIPTDDQHLPVIDPVHPETEIRSRVDIKNPWSSHPEIPERVKFLKNLALPSREPEPASPWDLFREPEPLQIKLTELLFAPIRFEKTPVKMDLTDFQARYLNGERRSYPRVFNGYYSNRRIASFNPEEPCEPGSFKLIDELFPVTRQSIPWQLDVVQLDLRVLQNLNTPDSGVSTFQFCEKEYTARDIPGLVTSLEAEHKRLDETLAQNDREIFQFMLKRASDKEKRELADAYRTYFGTVTDSDTAIRKCSEIMQTLYAAMEKAMSYDQAQTTLEQICKYEEGFKKEVADMREEAASQRYLPDSQLSRFDTYIAEETRYHGGIEFRKSEVEKLDEICRLWITLMLEREFRHKLSILECQERILKSPAQRSL